MKRLICLGRNGRGYRRQGRLVPLKVACKMGFQSEISRVLLGRNVHLTDSFSFPSASQSSTASSTMNVPLSPRHTLQATQPLSLSPSWSICMSGAPQRLQEPGVCSRATTASIFESPEVFIEIE